MATEDSQCPEIFYPQWQNEYEAAFLEPEPEKLSERVQAAETAIYERLQQISQNAEHHTERQVIADALAALRVLKRDELGFPDWEKT
jgi:hypothetical protein